MSAMKVEEVLAQVTRVVAADAAAWEERRESAVLPRLTLTYAQSIDGSIAAERGTPTILSGSASMKMTHLLRTLHDGILVGVGTIRADNPSLNARLVEGKNPRTIIVDTHLQCPLDIKLFTNPSCVKPILLCGEPNDEDTRTRRARLEAAGAKVIVCPTTIPLQGSRPRIDLRLAFKLLLQEGISSIMIEGGASIILACLQECAHDHFVDRAIVTVAPVFIGGLHAVEHRVSTVGAFPRLRQPCYLQLVDDLVIMGTL